MHNLRIKVCKKSCLSALWQNGGGTNDFCPCITTALKMIKDIFLSMTITESLWGITKKDNDGENLLSL
jgi:hypothetical protein